MTPDVPLAPDQPEVMSHHAPPAPPPPRPPGHTRARLGSLRRLSDRTPLRTKLITAVLALVIVASAAISVSEHLRAPGEPDQAARSSDGALVNQINFSHGIPGGNGTSIPAYVRPNTSGQVVAIQVPGQPTPVANPGSRVPRGSKLRGAASLRCLPRRRWADAKHGKLFTARAQSGRTAGDSSPKASTTRTRPAAYATARLVVGHGPRQHQRDDPAAHRLRRARQRRHPGDLPGRGRRGRPGQPARRWIDIELTAGQIAGGAPEPPGPRAGPAHRDRQPRPVAERDAQPDRDRLPRPGGIRGGRAPVGGTDAPVHRRRRATSCAPGSPRCRGFAEYYRQRGGVQPDGMTPR